MSLLLTLKHILDLALVFLLLTLNMYNLVKEKKGFSEDGEEIILLYKIIRCLGRSENISISDFKMFHIIFTCAAHGALNLHPL